ncbi:ATP-binding protein [Couchioplanes caeruleus]|uniref:ATP-binding protein n=1 Tax=Couchioplanes caeruleus TaxID=56438 RepID=UPI0011602C3D|nr:ATP-binding protein [Couchioplanes caeruleus]
MAVVADVDTAMVEVTVSGRWDRWLQEATAPMLRGCLAAHPAAIILDLHDLGDPRGASAPLWRAIRLCGAQMQSPVPVVACLPIQAPLAGALRRRGGRRVLPLYPSVPEARAVLGISSTTDQRRRLRLVPELADAVRARQMVTDACAIWHLSELAPRARLVVSELVVNAVEHAVPTIEATVTRLPAGMQMAVYDDDPHLPCLRRSGREPGDVTARRLGLRVVHHAASAWGSLPTRTGKMVWAVVTCHQR